MVIKCCSLRIFNLQPVFQAHLPRSLCQKPSFPVDVMQPFCHQLRGVSAGLCAGKAQPVTAQDAFVRVRAQERLHQRGEAGLFRFFPRLHLQSFVHLRQQLSPFPVG